LAVSAALLTAACGGDDDAKSASQSASKVAASASAAASSATAAAGSAAASATAAAGSALASATAAAGSAAASATAAAGSAVASATSAPTGANSVQLQLGTDAPLEIRTQSCTYLDGVGLSYAGQATGVQIVLSQAGTEPATLALLGTTTGTDTAAKLETKADGTFTTTATVAGKAVTITGHCDALVGKGGQ
jgi:hypothetical protein